MNTRSFPTCIGFRQVTKIWLLALTGLLLTACAGGPADRSSAVKMADALKGKTKQDLLICAGAPRSESTSGGSDSDGLSA